MSPLPFLWTMSSSLRAATRSNSRNPSCHCTLSLQTHRPSGRLKGPHTSTVMMFPLSQSYACQRINPCPAFATGWRVRLPTRSTKKTADLLFPFHRYWPLAPIHVKTASVKSNQQQQARARHMRNESIPCVLPSSNQHTHPVKSVKSPRASSSIGLSVLCCVGLSESSCRDVDGSCSCCLVVDSLSLVSPG